jgi:hypothetical protein
MEARGIRCPICGQIDSVQKVSAVVNSGTSYRELVGGYNKSQTALSNQLAIPELNLDILNQLRTVGIIFLCVGIPFAACGTAAAFGSLGNGHIDLTLGLTIYSFVALGLLFLIPALILRYQKIAADKPKRERARVLWEKLYYCSRDDVVFVPGFPDQSFPASNTRKMLGY